MARWNSQKNDQAASSGGTTDLTARALAKAAADRLAEVYPKAGTAIDPGSTVSVDTTDGGILQYTNPTGAPVALPNPASKAALATAGLVPATNKTGAVIDVADNAALAVNTESKADPANLVVEHFTAPAPQKEAFYTLTNTGAGTVDVGGFQLTGQGQLQFRSNEAGTAWVLVSREGTVTANDEVTQAAVVTARNTIANLLQTPTGPVVWEVNGIEINAGITNVGQAVTVNAATLGYNIEPGTDRVFATYPI